MRTIFVPPIPLPKPKTLGDSPASHTLQNERILYDSAPSLCIRLDTTMNQPQEDTTEPRQGGGESAQGQGTSVPENPPLASFKEKKDKEMQKKYEKGAKQRIEDLHQKSNQNMKDVDKNWETTVMEKLRQALDSDSCRTAEHMSSKYESWKAKYFPESEAAAARRASYIDEPRDYSTGKYISRNKPGDWGPVGPSDFQQPPNTALNYPPTHYPSQAPTGGVLIGQTGTESSGSFLGSNMYTATGRAGSGYQVPSNTQPFPPARNDQFMWPAGGVPAGQSQSREQPTFLFRPAPNIGQVGPVSSHQRPSNNPAYPQTTNYQPQSPTGGVALVQSGNLRPSTPFLEQRVYTSGPQPSSGQQGSEVQRGGSGQRNKTKEGGK
ncbi:hypothetical protein V8F33_013460 [Rhypophila sp. PSN 637]